MAAAGRELRGTASQSAEMQFRFRCYRTPSFKEWEFREVIATVATENVASHRVMQKLGFQPMGLHHQWGKVVTLYELTRKQWLSQAAPDEPG